MDGVQEWVQCWESERTLVRVVSRLACAGSCHCAAGLDGEDCGGQVPGGCLQQQMRFGGLGWGFRVSKGLGFRVFRVFVFRW